MARSFKLLSKMPGIWLCRLISKSRYQSSSMNFVLLLLIGIFATKSVSAIEGESETVLTENRSSSNIDNEISQIKNVPANHRIDDSEEIERPTLKIMQQPSRNSRQYDAPISSSSSGNYAAISGDGGAYVAQVPLTGTNYGSSSGAGSGSSSSYAHDLSGAYHPNIYHDPISLARGYSASISPIHHAAAAGYSPPFGGGPISSMFSAGTLGNAAGGGGLLSNSMFPLMSKGFDLSEIVCTAVAVAIGAVIIGAPFILIYLFVMNQMNNNGSNMGPNGGSISLTGPTSSTNVSGRKKRQISFPEAFFKQLSPLINNEQVANTFKALMSSIAKYQM